MKVLTAIVLLGLIACAYCAEMAQAIHDSQMDIDEDAPIREKRLAHFSGFRLGGRGRGFGGFRGGRFNGGRGFGNRFGFRNRGNFGNFRGGIGRGRNGFFHG